MTQNIIIPNKDNKVTLEFSNIDLTLATNIVVKLGAETYTKLLNPALVVVDNATQLTLDLSSTNEIGKKFVTITYFDAASINGTDITSRELGNLDKIVVAIGSQLIIEDGSIVANANSFATDAELLAYADLRGLDYPSTQPDREALLIKAMDYIFNIEKRFMGVRTIYAQELPFPRAGLYLHGFVVGLDVIPKQIKSAQIELALQAYKSDLLINKSSSNVESEKVGDLEVSYFSGGSWEVVRTDRADAYLKPLFKNNSLLTRV